MNTILDVQDLHSLSPSSMIYPNPMRDNATLLISDYGENNESQMHFRMYDATGRMVNDETIQVLPGKNHFPFRKENLPSGIYTYIINSERTILSSGKVIVD